MSLELPKVNERGPNINTRMLFADCSNSKLCKQRITRAVLNITLNVTLAGWVIFRLKK